MGAPIIKKSVLFLASVVQLSVPQSWACPLYFEETPQAKCRYQGPYKMEAPPLKFQQPERSKPHDNGQVGAWRTLPYVKILDDGLDPAAIALGQRLFFSKDLSLDRSLSCSSCHDPTLAFTDQKPQSTNGSGKSLKRNSPSLFNMIFQQRFFWDGRASSPEEQVLGPLFSKDEMNMSPENLWQRLQEIPEILNALKSIAPPKHQEPPQVWSVRSVSSALISYQATLLSFDSPFDRWALGEHNALNKDEYQGFNIFRSFVSRCSECHIPPLFTSNQLVVIGAPDHPKAGLDRGASGNLIHSSSANTKDFSENPSEPSRNAPLLHGAFKVPSIRNIAKTAPFMHSGAFQTLGEVLRFYNRGGGRTLGLRSPQGLHWHIRPMTLSTREIQLLESFLGSLTDSRLQIPAQP